MPVALTIGQYGVIVIDEEENLLWEFRKPALRFYGIDINPKDEHFFVTTYNEILEITKTGQIVWQYSSPEMQDLHSIQLLPQGNLLVSCAKYDKVLEIDKKKGIVWQWNAAKHFTLPENYNPEVYNWLHLNHAFRLPNENTIIGMYYDPREKLPTFYSKDNAPDGMIVLVNKEGNILWSWGKRITKHQHYVLPYKDRYIVSDNANKRLIVFHPDEGILYQKKFNEEPHGLCIKPNGHILVTFAKDNILRELDSNFSTIWEYKLPETIRSSKSVRLTTPLYLPKWDVEFSEEEKKEIEARLRSFGYID